MTWQLGRTDGIVDALDAQGRHMPVVMPSLNAADLFVESGFAAAPQLTFQPLAPAGWHPAVHILIGLGLGLGIAGTVAVMWLLP